MADYQLTATEEPCVVLRYSDGASIPPDMANTDYNCTDPMQPNRGYIQWKEAGGVPDPYVAPIPPPDVPTPEEQILLDHENRIRSIEGQPPLTMDQFLDKVAAPAPEPAAPEHKGRSLPKRKG